jgi:hypothetical protein
MSKSYAIVKGFMGRTTSFDSALIKSNVLIMGVVNNGEARYIHGERGKCLLFFEDMTRVFSIRLGIVPPF